MNKFLSTTTSFLTIYNSLQFLHFKISSPTVSGKSYSNKVNTSEFFKTVKNYETFNITNELGSFVFGNVKPNTLVSSNLFMLFTFKIKLFFIIQSLYQYFDKQNDPLFDEVAIHDFDYFDRSEIAFMKTLSGNA